MATSWRSLLVQALKVAVAILQGLHLLPTETLSKSCVDVSFFDRTTRSSMVKLNVHVNREGMQQKRGV